MSFRKIGKLPVCLGILFCLTVSEAEDFRPNLGPERPSITVTSGDLTLLLRQRTQWTPGRIDFRSHPMTTESSAYSTVFSFPDVGFIGTGHLENEPEELQTLSFFLDGKEVKEPSEELKGGIFRFERQSRIRNFSLHNVTELKDNRLIETARVETEKEQPLKLIYHFMHAWKPSVSEFLAGVDADSEKDISGPLGDDEQIARKFFVNEEVDWVAVFEPESGQFAVSRLLEAPEGAGNISMIWNVPNAYRKYYLKCFNNDTVPAGFEGTWKMVTAFGVAEKEEWKEAARGLAGSLKDS